MRLLFILFLSFSSFCYGNEKERLQTEDAAVLNIFFQTMFGREGGGYVLFDQKPVCWSGFDLYDSKIPSTFSHKNSVAIKEGMRVWKNLNLKNKNIFLHCYDKNNSYGSVDLLLINRSLCLKSIKDNLSLFQYILGPKLTPESLFDALLSAKDFDSILKHDRVLIGIILGYGSTNAIMGSRSENIKDALLLSPDTPPFESKLAQAPLFTKDEKEFVFFSPSKAPSKQTNLYPSFGFASLEEEFCTLEESMECSPSSLEQEPAFIFGYVKNDQTSQALIKKLEEVQPKVRALMDSPMFVAEVLKIITGRDFEVDIPRQFELKMNAEQVSRLNQSVAKNIWNQIKTSDQEYINEFLIGFKEHDSQEDIRCGFFPDNYKNYLQQARKNILESYRLFYDLEKNQEFTSIVSKKLYYKVHKRGNGKKLSEPAFVKLSYQISDPNDICLVTEFEKVIDSSQTIPGFAYGIKGMLIGETREIYIAPSLAYGVYTLLDKGIYLKAKVTLLDILPEKLSKSFPELKPIDMSFVFDPLFEARMADENKQVARFEGARVSKHYVKGKTIDIKKIYSHLVDLKNDKMPSDVSNEEYDMINKLHWNIYYGTEMP